ncbi:uncharacterized protein [Watersipora subatra]|uniref:uncharacterized protein n=1 Tax=Watersipora subatra TaxID=2589382 RepID=UPI00355B6166
MNRALPHNTEHACTCSKVKKVKIEEGWLPTLQNLKRVNQDLYENEAPTVDIDDDRREKDFRIDIDSWTLNKHEQQVRRTEPAGSSEVTAHIEAPSSDIQLNPDKPYEKLSDDQCIQQPNRHRPRRMGSIISIRNENLGFIPENEIISSTASTSLAANSSFGSPAPSATAGLNNDNPQQASPTSSSDELILDLSQLDLSMSSDQFALSKSRTKNFYETFGPPRTVSTDKVSVSTEASSNSNKGADNSDLNISLSSLAASKSICQNVCQTSQTKLSVESSPPAQNTVSTPDATQAAKHFKKAKHSGTSTRVKYFTQLKLGETANAGRKKEQKTF